MRTTIIAAMLLSAVAASNAAWSTWSKNWEHQAIRSNLCAALVERITAVGLETNDVGLQRTRWSTKSWMAMCETNIESVAQYYVDVSRTMEAMSADTGSVSIVGVPVMLTASTALVRAGVTNFSRRWATNNFFTTWWPWMPSYHDYTQRQAVLNVLTATWEKATWANDYAQTNKWVWYGESTNSFDDAWDAMTMTASAWTGKPAAWASGDIVEGDSGGKFVAFALRSKAQASGSSATNGVRRAAQLWAWVQQAIGGFDPQGESVTQFWGRIATYDAGSNATVWATTNWFVSDSESKPPNAPEAPESDSTSKGWTLYGRPDYDAMWILGWEFRFR